jgi:collagenase-like PrtC family protease
LLGRKNILRTTDNTVRFRTNLDKNRHRTGTEQAQNRHRTGTEQAQNQQGTRTKTDKKLTKFDKNLVPVLVLVPC